MSIVILGLAKTGTTGLYTATKKAIKERGEDWYFLFEPTKRRQLRSLRRYAPEMPLLTKAMLRKETRFSIDYSAFEHRVMTVRDPRDIVVSHLLFRPLILRSVVSSDRGSVDEFVALIREKVADPTSHSLRELHARGDELGVGSSGFVQIDGVMDRMIELERDLEFYMVRYEDFVDGKLEGLSDYLGLEVRSVVASSESWLGHIARSKSYGEWHNWFLEEDVEYFRPLFARFMEHFGYPDEWELPDGQGIDPASSSEYIAKKLSDRRRQVTERQSEAHWTPERVVDDLEIGYLTERAEDGDALSAHRLALALLTRSSRPADRREAIRWAHRGAVQGHQPCMELLAEALARGGEEDRWRAVFWTKQSEVSRRRGADREPTRAGGTSGDAPPTSTSPDAQDADHAVEVIRPTPSPDPAATATAAPASASPISAPRRLARRAGRKLSKLRRSAAGR